MSVEGVRGEAERPQAWLQCGSTVHQAAVEQTWALLAQLETEHAGHSCSKGVAGEGELQRCPLPPPQDASQPVQSEEGFQVTNWEGGRHAWVHHRTFAGSAPQLMRARGTPLSAGSCGNPGSPSHRCMGSNEKHALAPCLTALPVLMLRIKCGTIHKAGSGESAAHGLESQALFTQLRGEPPQKSTALVLGKKFLRGDWWAGPVMAAIPGRKETGNTHSARQALHESLAHFESPP